ncbi:MAG: PEP-CTERM sorting domain-containing protein [Okeania sp. SIO3H1]|uniref:chromophore lyase CpcT/CpeT n=1 Tax=Okeania sp. SIO1I7 TaxID=2607772 RepID=UPI0013C5ED6C|nr:chromophore lyase CpcT/CpeT [Okeania sp. SIO1I7]NEN87457.1 PEP-CTERM sorting domain-containing protein [Okeania sp. SIO3H1]NET26893.1 PEP-CTERM sorting domain-containing protein [Okeania sp. SIO1I7]
MQINQLKFCTLSTLLLSVTFAQKSHAATMMPPILFQVEQVSQWFTGLFDNTKQVADNPMIPQITMSNCPVKLIGSDLMENTETVYLEQTTGGFPFRVRLYSFFSNNDSQVTISISRFLNETSLFGLCDRPESEQFINATNLDDFNCEVNLSFVSNTYVGTNDPEGCSTTFPGGKVVSDIVIQPNSIDSLDSIFDSNGNLLFGTPITFNRIEAVPEPSILFGLFILSGLGLGKASKYD